MALGEFTREEASDARSAANEIFLAIPKARRNEQLGALNSVLVFISAAEREMREQRKAGEPKPAGPAPEAGGE